MSATPDFANAAVQAWMKSGQEAAARFVDFLSRHQAAFQQAPVAPLPMPDTEQLAALQREMLQRHAALWSAMLQRKSGEGSAPVVSPEPGDRRFSSAEWSSSPVHDYMRQAYLINAEYFKRVADAVPLADGKAKTRLQFFTRQFVDAMAPSNFAATNPEFVKTALETKGESITAGLKNLIADLEKGRISITDESKFEVGRNLAITPGAVVFENEVMQLVQYSPLTETVSERPLLLVPPCINKFYIMDLQPENSLIRYMVEQGETVFLISWRNAKADIGHLTWDDYLEKGPLTALRVVREITGVDKPNSLGYCVGGTILCSALAVARARGEDPVSSVTLFTTLLDFADAGEIGHFIDEAMLATRDAQIGKGGLLQGRELATMFSFLRANDLVWQYVVGNYLKGRTPEAFDILFWNSDSTNLPGPFFTWYARNTYLNNSLRVPGKLEMLGERVDLTRVSVPSYIVAAREDHIVPWPSAYLSRQILGGPSTFVLGASGHIAGIINPAAKNRRSYWTNDAEVASAADWFAGATENKGSWWPHWAKWIKSLAGGERPARGRLGSERYPALEPAPGRYVKENA